MKNFILLFILNINILSVLSQKANHCFPFANKIERETLLRKLHDTIIDSSAKAYLLYDTPINWNSYAWATAYVQDTSAQNRMVLEKIFKSLKHLKSSERQFVIQTAFSCFPNTFIKQIEKIARQENENLKIFASAIAYLAMNKVDVYSLLDNFVNIENPIIVALYNQYKSLHTPLNIYQLKELFEQNKKQGNKILYSLQFVNRDKAGLAIIQYADGKFARKKDGKLCTVDQLARSITNLPAYVTNGNTPTGLYRINKLDKSNNLFIGPTHAFVAYLPFEAEAYIYYNDTQTEYSLASYLNYFPTKWHSNKMLQQAYWAGKAGRSKIHFHGTTIDPELYKNKNFYPQTPSMGCLCTTELWDEKGCLIYSDQQKLIDLWTSTPDEGGYAYVLEIQDMNKLDIKNILEEITK